MIVLETDCTGQGQCNKQTSKQFKSYSLFLPPHEPLGEYVTVGEAEDTLIVRAVNLLILVLKARLVLIFAGEDPPMQ